jgi:hypothetical protein
VSTAAAGVPATGLLLPERRRLAGEPPAALARLLARAEPVDSLPGEQAQLRRWFRVEGGDWPVAAIQRQAEAGDAGDGTWLRADPVYVQAEMTGARLMAWGALGLSAAEADALIEALSPSFGDEGIDIGRTAPEHWYLRLPADTSFPAEAVAPGDALGEDLFAHLPPGDSGRRWRRLQSEAQILLTQHPVNAARRSRGAPLANSVWFWGGGRHPGAVTPWRAAATVATRDQQLAALARGAGLTVLPEDDGKAGLVDVRRARHWEVVAHALAPRIPGAIEDGLVLDFADAHGLRIRATRWWQRWP